jgi:hypothetical protein
MEGSCSTGQSPQWAVVPVEEEEEIRRWWCMGWDLGKDRECSNHSGVVP